LPPTASVVNSTAMSDLDEVVDPPGFLATVVSHFLIAFLVAVATKALFRQRLVVAVVAGLIGFAVDLNFDAPLARKLDDLGPQAKGRLRVRKPRARAKHSRQVRRAYRARRIRAILSAGGAPAPIPQ